jgi:hypothetical protein
MSFSIGAAGTREETLKSLETAQTNDNNLGDLAVQFAKELVTQDETEPTETQDVRYSVNASGHCGKGSLSTISVSFNTSLVPKPVPSV